MNRKAVFVGRAPRGSTLLASRRRQVAQVSGFGTRLADVGERRTKLPARAMENVGCLLHVTAVQKQDGELYVAVCAMQCLARLLAAAPGEPREDVFAASNELLTNGLEIHHQAIVDPPEQDHDHG